MFIACLSWIFVILLNKFNQSINQSTKMKISLTLRNLLAAAMQQAMISVPPTSVQTAPVPSFQNYEIGLEKWGAYMQRLNQRMIAHAVGDQHKKKTYFLSWVGANTYELINKLFSRPPYIRARRSVL